MPKATAPTPRASSTLRPRSRRCSARCRWARSTCAMSCRCSGLSPGSRDGSMRRANGASPAGCPGAAIFPAAASARRQSVTSGREAGQSEGCGRCTRRGSGSGASSGWLRAGARPGRAPIGRAWSRDQEGAEAGACGAAGAAAGPGPGPAAAAGGPSRQRPRSLRLRPLVPEAQHGRGGGAGPCPAGSAPKRLPALRPLSWPHPLHGVPGARPAPVP